MAKSIYEGSAPEDHLIFSGGPIVTSVPKSTQSTASTSNKKDGTEETKTQSKKESVKD